MKKDDIKDASIIALICLCLSSLATFIFIKCLFTIGILFSQLDLSFLLDEDFSDYENMTITITIVDEHVQETIPTKPIEPAIPYIPRRFHPHKHITDSWIPQNELDCLGASFIPMVGWQCPSLY